MKTKLISALGLSLLMSASAMAQDSSGTLTLTIYGYSDPQAVIELGLFDSEDGWDSETSIQDIRVVADGISVEVVIEGLQPGEYGIMLFHDENNDGELNMNFAGIPREDYAFSNNARGRFGPASWENARFTIEVGENTHRIEM